MKVIEAMSSLSTQAMTRDGRFGGDAGRVDRMSQVDSGL